VLENPVLSTASPVSKDANGNALTRTNSCSIGVYTEFSKNAQIFTLGIDLEMWPRSCASTKSQAVRRLL
jgi:hypothetical protein